MLFHFQEVCILLTPTVNGVLSYSLPRHGASFDFWRANLLHGRTTRCGATVSLLLLAIFRIKNWSSFTSGQNFPSTSDTSVCLKLNHKSLCSIKASRLCSCCSRTRPLWCGAGKNLESTFFLRWIVSSEGRVERVDDVRRSEGMRRQLI